jgi:hypothetical protein
MTEATAATAIGALLEHVRAASVDGMIAPNGEPFEVEVEHAAGSSEAVVAYRLGATVLGVRRLRVSERTRVVTLLGFELPTWWFDGTSVHEQFLDNLRVADARSPEEGGCLLSAVLAGPRAGIWTPYYDWATGMGNANAAALASAVAHITSETAWGGNDLPERVQGLGPGTWHDLVSAMSPASLVVALDGLEDGLAHTVFAHIGAWYGEKAIA